MTTIENSLRVLEQQQAELLNRIKTEKSVKNIEKRELARLVAWMCCRVPLLKKLAKKITDELYCQLSKNQLRPLSGMPSCVDRAYENNSLLTFIYSEPQKKDFLDVLETFRYVLVIIPKEDKKFFITSDNPVAIVCNEELPPRYFVFAYCQPSCRFAVQAIQNYAGFTNKSFQLFLPIDRKYAIWCHRNENNEEELFPLNRNDSQVDDYNSRTILSADEEIYAPEITDELKKLIKKYWSFRCTSAIDTGPFCQEETEFFMRNVCNIKGDYGEEDVSREIRNKGVRFLMCVSFPLTRNFNDKKNEKFRICHVFVRRTDLIDS